MATAAPLTPEMSCRKGHALQFVKGYLAQWGISPSLSELAAHLDVSRQRAHAIVQQLSDDRQLTVVAGKARGIRLPGTDLVITEGEALLRLAELGYIVHCDRTLSPPLTKTGLTGLPVLDHDPGEDRAGS